MKKRGAIELMVRYLLSVLLALGNLWIFYKIFTPLTVYPVVEILNLFYSGVYLVQGITIGFNGFEVSIIPACVAGSAYYLLTILNLITPMKKEVRLKSLCFLFGAFLLLNIIRIVFFSMLFSSGFAYFELAHKFTWYAISTVMVIAVWFANVRIFNIKEIPAYSDIKKVLGDVKKKRIDKKKK